MTYFIFFGMPGGMELVVIVFVILLLFGGRKIPELMRGLGKGIKEFNTARASLEDELQKGMEEEEKKQKKLEAERLASIKAEKEKIEAEKSATTETE